MEEECTHRFSFWMTETYSNRFSLLSLRRPSFAFGCTIAEKRQNDGACIIFDSPVAWHPFPPSHLSTFSPNPKCNCNRTANVADLRSVASVVQGDSVKKLLHFAPHSPFVNQIHLHSLYTKRNCERECSACSCSSKNGTH